MNEPHEAESAGAPQAEDEAPESPVVGGWIVDFDLPYFISVVDSMDDQDLRNYAAALDEGTLPEPNRLSFQLRPSNQ